MDTQLKRSFRTYFVESRFLSIIMSVVVVGMRFLLYLQKGLPETSGYKTNFVWGHIEPFLEANPFVSFVGSTGVVLLIAVLISELNIRYGIIRLRTSMPFFIPLLLLSVHPSFLRLTPDLVALVFVLWALFPLFSTYQHQRSHKYAFQFGALLAIGSVFQIYTLLFLPIWLFALKALDQITVRSVLSSLFGVLIVYWIVFSMFVFADNIGGFASPFAYLIKVYDFSYVPAFTVPQWGFIVTFVLLVVIYLVLDSQQIVRERSFTKKVLMINLSVVIFTIFMQIIYFSHTLFFLYTGLAFMSMALSHYYTNVERRPQVYSYFALLGVLLIYFILNIFTNLTPL